MMLQSSPATGRWRLAQSAAAGSWPRVALRTVCAAGKGFGGPQQQQKKKPKEVSAQAARTAEPGHRPHTETGRRAAPRAHPRTARRRSCPLSSPPTSPAAPTSPRAKCSGACRSHSSSSPSRRCSSWAPQSPSTRGRRGAQGQGAFLVVLTQLRFLAVLLPALHPAGCP